MRKGKQAAASVVLAGMLTVAGSAGFARAGSSLADEKGEKVNFATQIAPILKESCVKCHSADNTKKRAAGGLQLDNKAAAFKGGKSGKSIVPGDAKSSLLYEVLLGPVKQGKVDLPAMPKARKGQPFKALEQGQIDLIGKWIDQGANWPD